MNISCSFENYAILRWVAIELGICPDCNDDLSKLLDKIGKKDKELADSLSDLVKKNEELYSIYNSKSQDINVFSKCFAEYNRLKENAEYKFKETLKNKANAI